MPFFHKNALRLYLVLETSLLKIPLGDFIRSVTEAGVTAIQLRDKFASNRARFETGLEIKKNFGKLKPVFIINDNIDLALALNADGFHLGAKDIPIAVAKKIAPNMILGYSCNGLEDCIEACKYADYAGVGPVYHTDTKKDLRGVLGLHGLAENLGKLSCPAVAIGGINEKNCREVMSHGADGVAVSSYVCGSIDPYEAVSNILKLINERV